VPFLAFEKRVVTGPAQDVPRSISKVYKRNHINNINKVTISLCPNIAKAPLPTMKISN
jgi:hypothetical protein